MTSGRCFPADVYLSLSFPPSTFQVSFRIVPIMRAASQKKNENKRKYAEPEEKVIHTI